MLTGRNVWAAAFDAPEILIYKSPTCGCCTKWIDHIAAAGFRTIVRDTGGLDALKRELGVPRALQSCHTSLVDGYVLEGHVPADVAQKFLAEKPRAVGLAVAGMPMGSPGMEGPTQERYDVVLFRRDGTTSVYAKK